jgi:hypothetical protein
MRWTSVRRVFSRVSYGRGVCAQSLGSNVKPRSMLSVKPDVFGLPVKGTWSGERKERAMLKTIASTLGAAALVMAPLNLTATPAFADSDISQLCSQNADFGLSHGACVSLVESNGHSSAVFVSVCKEIQQQYPAAFNALFKNRGECVSTLNHQPSKSPIPSPSPTSSPSLTPKS